MEKLTTNAIPDELQLDRLAKTLKFINQQAAILATIDLHDEGMPDEVAGDLLTGVSEGHEDEVLETIARVGQKFIKYFFIFDTVRF